MTLWGMILFVKKSFSVLTDSSREDGRRDLLSTMRILFDAFPVWLKNRESAGIYRCIYYPS